VCFVYVLFFYVCLFLFLYLLGCVESVVCVLGGDVFFLVSLVMLLGLCFCIFCVFYRIECSGCLAELE